MITNKQKRAVKIIEYFAPTNCDWKDKKAIKTILVNTPELKDTKETKNAITAEEAYFLYTDRGILSKEVNNLGRFLKLYWGHRRRPLQEKMWQEGFEEGFLFPEDFKDEKEYIQEIAKKCCEGVGRKWEVNKP